MKKAIIILCSGIILATICIINVQTKPAITYFPIDQDTTFSTAKTSLSLFTEKGNDNYKLLWQTNSTTDIPVYLRQDVSLLFDNGRLRGALTKWVQDTDTIQLKEILQLEDSSLYQSISFHHGEIHKSRDEIKSIQKMSSDYLYVIDSPTTPLVSFKTAKSNYEREWKNLLDRTSKQQLLYHWNTLLNHFQIDKEKYLAVPLTVLDKYQSEPLPSLSQAQTDKIIGQLWEGLYKNYVIPIVKTEKEVVDSYIPLILFDKENKHLLVLFELNKKKKQLIQKYSL
ncbi:hypothetical protein [Virgibacillus proomii]|uniref:hypothetical protein n=1 Tax=Virgibacillus proomii TaxID=84407 RepID=UPI001C115241|nr:hypothetical protein [Virgibacillus proomii]MBU5265948.1 hypothetical protein [Virgibacillus proomii]